METYENLRNARVRIGITQDYVAKQLNVPRTAVVQMESGSRKIASDELSTLCELASSKVRNFISHCPSCSIP